jgi:hypothetical protein
MEGEQDVQTTLEMNKDGMDLARKKELRYSGDKRRIRWEKTRHFIRRRCDGVLLKEEGIHL